MKANKDFLKNNERHSTLRIYNEHFDNDEYEKILGINEDCKLNFQKHQDGVLVTNKSTCKVKALLRTVNYLSISKQKKVNKRFFDFIV